MGGPDCFIFNKDGTIDVDECDVDGGRVVLAAVVGVDDEGVPLHVLEVDLLPQNHLSSLIMGDFPSTLPPFPWAPLYGLYVL